MENKKNKNNNRPGKISPAEQMEIRCNVSTIRIEKRSDDPDGSTGRRIVGYAAPFDKWSDPIMGWFQERIAHGAFDGADLSSVIMCFNHREESILARTESGTLTLSVDEHGLRFEFDAPHTTCGNDMVELVGRGDITKCSFKFHVESDEWVYADEENGLQYDQRTILKFSKVFDVALVVFPAYHDTEASVRHLERRRKQHRPESNKKDGGKAESESRNRLVEMMRRVVH